MRSESLRLVRPGSATFLVANQLLHGNPRNANFFYLKNSFKTFKYNTLYIGDNFGRRFACEIGFSGQHWPLGSTLLQMTGDLPKIMNRKVVWHFCGESGSYAENAGSSRLDIAKDA
jgi:hypothetical protein